MSLDDLRRRRDDDPSDGDGGAPDDAGSDALNGARRDTARLLDEADAIARRALAGDSAAFLRAGRQQGGE